MAQNKKILIVDDSLELVEVLTELIQCTITADVFRAGNAEYAMSVLKNEKIDILITDLVMPCAGGVDLLCCAREIGLLPENIIIFSGHGQGLLSGLPLAIKEKIVFFEKPYGIDELLDYVNSRFYLECG